MKSLSCSFILLCFLTTACRAGDATPQAPAPAPPTTSLDGIQENMPYADARRALLKHGWTPMVDKQCLANVVGGDFKTLCAAHSDASCKACEQMPELSSCGSGGVCLMRFYHAGKHQRLEIGTVGDIGDGNVHGGDSQIFVTGWTVKPAVSH